MSYARGLLPPAAHPDQARKCEDSQDQALGLLNEYTNQFLNVFGICIVYRREGMHAMVHV